ncbi:MAG TPA: DUF2723 domain-containing protein [Kofleriaceae bacterium]|nr:DUF2723 domain-containing protein [Kofleriaceae bacterium]
MATLGTIGGVAHPPGYPLYLIWLRAFSWLPAQSPAHASAIATAILGALGVLVLHAACRAWGARPRAASLTVAIFAAAPAVLRIQTEAEVFAMNNLIVALVLWLSATRGPLRGYARIFALGLVAGFGLSDHLTCVLAAPVGILGVVRGVRETKTGAVGGIGIAIAGLVLGLTPYLYLLATHDTNISWTRIDDVTHLVHHFLRKDYGGPGAFSPHGKEVSALESIWVMVQTVGRTWLWLPAIAGVAVLVRCIARAHDSETRVAWSMLAVSFVLAGPALASRFNVVPEGIGLYVVRRFHILPALLLAPAVAVAFDHAATWLERRSEARAIRSDVVGGVLAIISFAAFTGLSLDHVVRVHSPAVDLGLRQTLRSLPKDAVVIVHPDLMHFGLGYLQGAERERPDVTVISWAQVPSLTYRQRMAKSGIDLEPRANGRITTVDVAEQVLAKGRPLLIDPYNSNIAQAFPTYPFGILFRVVPKEQRPPSIEEVFTTNRDLFEHFDFSYPMPGFDDEYATDLHQQYARLWHTLAKGLEMAGRGEDAAVANAFAEALAPKP